LKKLYSIVDIEATGGNSKIGRITEVAIIQFDGEKIVDQFETLVNPERDIPYYVQRLTGITNKMAATAPLFEVVAPKVFELLKDSIFVAHNVKSDYTFIQAELKKAGIIYKSDRLCTLELAAKLIPQVESHGLEKVSKHLEIEVENRHRAMGDALATVELLKHLISISPLPKLEESLRKA
jgi:DNA polymerase-3 subunit epsilon